MAKVVGLDIQVGDYFASRKQNGAVGLALLDKCIVRYATHGDYDALARFVVAAHQSSGTKEKVVRIIRAAFGNHVTFKLDKKADCGGVFTKVDWPGVAFPLSGSNTYGTVRRAVKMGIAWDDRAFLKELNEIVPAKPKAVREVSDAATKKVADHLVKYLTERMAEGFSTGEILALVQAELKALAPAPTRQVVNGIIELNA